MTALAEDNFAQRLEGLRTERGWSQERLAREMARVGVPIPQSAISKIERSRRTISVDELLGFADVFQAHPLNLLVNPGEPPMDDELHELRREVTDLRKRLAKIRRLAMAQDDRRTT